MIRVLLAVFLMLLSRCHAKKDAAFAPWMHLSTYFASSCSTISVSSTSRRSFRCQALVEDYSELPPDFPRRQDALVALAAVRKACSVTQRLQPTSGGGVSTLSSTTKDGIAVVSKLDLSPVTVADFAAQAVVLNHVYMAFGDADNSFIAEESSEPLRSDPDLAQAILEATALENLELVIKSIDLGKSYLSWDKKGGTGRPRRVWCLDPIDGTKGFLRGKRDGGQYAVALALLEDGVPNLGVLGCPNLPVSSTEDNYAWSEDENEDNNEDSRGCIFIASRGGGCFQLPLMPGSYVGKRVHVTPNDGSSIATSDARFCVGVEKGIADALGKCDEMAKILHGEENALDKTTGEIIKSRRIDSMAKYAVVARGEAEIYVRLPKPDYIENIWDHAAGCVVIEEAGGKITDCYGNPIDFSLGHKLSADVRGILGSNGGIFHDALVQSYVQQEKARQTNEEN